MDGAIVGGRRDEWFAPPGDDHALVAEEAEEVLPSSDTAKPPRPRSREGRLDPFDALISLFDDDPEELHIWRLDAPRRRRNDSFSLCGTVVPTAAGGGNWAILPRGEDSQRRLLS